MEDEPLLHPDSTCQTSSAPGCPDEWGRVHLGWTLHLSDLLLGLTNLLSASFLQSSSCVLLSRKSYPRSLLGELRPSCNEKLPFLTGTQPHRHSVLYTMQRNFFMNTQEETDLFMGVRFSPLSLRNHSELDLPFGGISSCGPLEKPVGGGEKDSDPQYE